MYGLLGEHLPHSFSPQIHALLGDYEYRLFEVAPDRLEQFMREHNFDGINVTIPYKKAVMKYLDVISHEAEKIGSVNTVTVRDGKLYGDNTDYFGFLYMIKKSGIEITDKKCLVLGSGGASLTAVAVLRDLNAKEIVIISRKGENNYENINIHSDAQIIVNTTPVGMYPNNLESAVDINLFLNLDGVLDIVYNPLKTKLILDAEERGIPCAAGLSMLVAQAKRANEIFFGISRPDSVCEEIEKTLRTEFQNIVLVGMAGCGKSTVGNALARLLGKKFVDTDEIIVKNEGISIPEIFEKYGENYFRACEAEAVKSVGKEKGLVIATGGGVVTREGNFYPLRQNGIVVFINRDVEKLPTNGRPLSQQQGVKALFEKRLHIYRRFAHIEIDGNGTVQETAELIAKELEKL
ncbi:MAG: shikimate kinase [Oscillospiraceae bacterium]|nr:shikimate kinase [Oscillospiraceae bacterium]